MSNTTVMITGASRRLGLFLCEKLVSSDFNVIAVTRKKSASLAALESDRLTIFELGTYSNNAVGDLIANIAKHTNRIDVLVHNASIFENDEECQSTMRDHYQTMFDMHMALPAQLNMGLQALLKGESSSGNIIHITDIYAENPNADYVLYCSTKAGLENLTKGFAKKFAPHIRVNSIQPGPIQFLSEHTETEKKAVLRQTLLDCEGGFLPIYQAIMSVIDNAYMTGCAIKVDGGRSLGCG